MLRENLSINVTPGGVPVTIHISQYDIGLRTFVFAPYTSHGTFTPDAAAAATLEGTKPDGNIIVHNCEYNATTGEITYTVQEQLAAVSGKVWSKLTIRDTSGGVIGYAAIIWMVDMAGVEDGAIASDSDISALQQFIAEFGTINAYKAALDGALAAVGGPYVASTVSQMTDHTKAYVYTGSQSGYTYGHWYYWNGSVWTDGGVYQAAAVETDKTLTVADMAADAKATGDRITELKNDTTVLRDNAYDEIVTIPASFVHGAYAGNGSISNTALYSIRSAEKVIFDKNVTFTIAEGFSVRRVMYNKTTGTFVVSGAWETGIVSFTTEYQYGINIRRTEYDETEIADIPLFTSQVYIKRDINAYFNAYFDYGMPPGLLSMFKKTDNMFAADFNNHITGAYYNGANNGSGVYYLNIAENANYQSWLIRVKPKTTYTLGPVQSNLTFFTAEYKLDKLIRTTDGLSATDPNTVVSGDNSAWMALTMRIDADMSAFMMVQGNTYPQTYISGYPQWVDYPTDPDDEMTYISSFYSYAPIRITYGSDTTVSIPAGRIVTKGGTILTAAQIMTLTVASGQWLTYDADAGEWINSIGLAGHKKYYIGFIVPGLKKSFLWAYCEETDATKTIAFFGDSIVAGSGVTGQSNSQIFHQYIHDLYGFTCLNYGYGGSGYIRNVSGTGGYIGLGEPGRGVPITDDNKLTNNTVLDRLRAISNPNFDAVVIFAGTNDYRHQDTYPYTDFVTALENTFSYYQSNYGTIPLLVMTPIKRKGGDVVVESRPKTMSDYRDAIIDACKKYSVPYIDTMTFSGLNPDNTENGILFYTRDDTSELDSVHPNHLAHQRIERTIGETLNQLVLWDTKSIR